VSKRGEGVWVEVKRLEGVSYALKNRKAGRLSPAFLMPITNRVGNCNLWSLLCTGLKEPT